MLVLSRKKGEQILVPECGVTVKVIAVQGNTIRIGIDAPPDVAIMRAEIRERDGQRPRRERVGG
jgi:carbon storage regulator CsrA